MPTRRASSTLVMRPSSCSSFRIFQSMASRRAGKGVSGSSSGLISPDAGRRETLLREPAFNAGLPIRMWDLGLRILHSSAEALH